MYTGESDTRLASGPSHDAAVHDVRPPRRRVADYLLLANTPNVSASSLSKDGAGNLAICELDETNYTNADQQDLGRGVLAMRHAVVLMPQAPLSAGLYRVSITSGGTVYAWSFTVGG